MNDKYICCICGKEFEEYGNNPEPVKPFDEELEWRSCHHLESLI